MFRTEDNYNLYFDGTISAENESNFKKLLAEYELAPEFANLLTRQHNFRIYNSYNEHKTLLWVLYEILGQFAITLFFAEADHPHGCEYQSRVDFFIDAGGKFHYELKNSIFMYEDYEVSTECKERIEQGSVGFDTDCSIKDAIQGMDVKTFVKRITAQ